MCIVAAAPGRARAAGRVSTPVGADPAAPIAECGGRGPRPTSGPSTTTKSFPRPWYFTKESGTGRIIARRAGGFDLPAGGRPDVRQGAGARGRARVNHGRADAPRLRPRSAPRRRRAATAGAALVVRDGVVAGGAGPPRRRDRAPPRPAAPARLRLRARPRVPARAPRAHRGARRGRGLLELARRDVRRREAARSRRLRDGRALRLLRARARGRDLRRRVPLPSPRPAGLPYPDPDLLALRVVRAARAVGLRIVLLRAAYAARPGGDPDPAQRALPRAVAGRWRSQRSSGSARPSPSIRSPPWGSRPTACAPARRTGSAPLAEAARARDIPLHVHAAEQAAEVAACRAEHGGSPVGLLAAAGALGPTTTLVHAIHLDDADVAAIGAAGATVCACPLTERNLGGRRRPRRPAPRGGRAARARRRLARRGRSARRGARPRAAPAARPRSAGGARRAARRARGAAPRGGHRRRHGLARPPRRAARAGRAGGLRRWWTSTTRRIAGAEAPDALLAALVFGMAPGAVRSTFVAGEPIMEDGWPRPAGPPAPRSSRTSARRWRRSGETAERGCSPRQETGGVPRAVVGSGHGPRPAPPGPRRDRLDLHALQPAGARPARARGARRSASRRAGQAGPTRTASRRATCLPARARRRRAGSRSSATPTACPSTRTGRRRSRARCGTAALFGRGAADTKGFLAAALVAARARPRAPRAPLTLLFTADEEVGCLGAKQLLAEGRVHPRHAIVGEPTRLTPVRAHKGYCAVEVVLTGVEGHSAYPDVGASAIHAAGRLFPELERIGEALRGESDAAFSPPHTTWNVGVIQGGKARNIIAGECRFTYEWRPHPRPGSAQGAPARRGGVRAARAASGGQGAGGGDAAPHRRRRGDARRRRRSSASSRRRAGTARPPCRSGPSCPR